MSHFEVHELGTKIDGKSMFLVIKWVMNGFLPEVAGYEISTDVNAAKKRLLESEPESERKLYDSQDVDTVIEPVVIENESQETPATPKFGKINMKTKGGWKLDKTGKEKDD